MKRLGGVEGSESVDDICKEILDVMTNNAGFFRTEDSLKTAEAKFVEIEKKLRNASVNSEEDALTLYKCENMLLIGRMAVAASMLRKESRGVFYRSDYPERNDKDWLKNIVVHNVNGTMQFEVCECIKS